MSDRVGIGKSEQVARVLEREIRAGRVLHGAQLESEGTLMQRFAVSRNTVRRGLQMLAHQGLITTRTGIGSFVTYDGTTIDSNLGWTVALSHGQDQIETRTLGIRRGTCGQTDGFLGRQGDCLCVDRLRYCVGTASGISLERSRLPWRNAYDGIPERGLTQGSLHLTLVELGLFPGSGEEVVSVAESLSPADAAIMQRPAGQPMLRLRRVTRCDDRTILEYVESLLDPARFGLRMEF